MEEVMRKTAAQKYNDNMNRIFEEAKQNNKKYAPLHLFTMLKDLTQKTEQINKIQHSKSPIPPEIWSELFVLTKQAKSILDKTKDYVLTK
jgi:hypothetical protein